MAPSSPTASSTSTSSSTRTSSLTSTQTPTPSHTYTSGPTQTSSASITSSQTTSSLETSSATSSSSRTGTSSYTSTHTATSSITSTSSQTATSSVSPLPQPIMLSQTGSYQYVQVPWNMERVKITMWGAGGGGSMTSLGSSTITGVGGGGAFVTGYLDVIPGETLRVIVGQGGSPLNSGATGGGCSLIQRTTNSGWIDIVIAAGGGGASGYYGQPPPGTWRTMGYGGGGGLDKGCDPMYEVPRGSIILIDTLIGLGANQTSDGINQGNCSSYQTGGGCGLFQGGSSCLGGAGGGTSLLSILQDSTLSQSAVCQSSQAGGMKNPYYSSKVGTGGNSLYSGIGGNGVVIFEWVWPNPVYLPPSFTGTAAPTATPTQTYNTLTSTKSYGASGSPSPSMGPSTTPTPAAKAEVGKSHLACSIAPSTVSSITLECPTGSIISTMGFMGCGGYTGTCGNYQNVYCNLMTKSAQALVTNTCTGKNNCTFTGAQLCSGPADDDGCHNGNQMSVVLQANCMAQTATLQAQALGAVKAIAQGVGPTTKLRYIHLNSIMSLSDGMMGFSELQIIMNNGTNIALQGNATSSSVLNSEAYGPNDYYICYSTSDLASAAIDGNFCTFFAANYDAQPWWNLDLGFGVPLSEISHIDIYVRQPYNDPYGATIDYSYQLDSATITLSDENGIIIFTGTLPWLSTISQPFIVNVADVLQALTATTDVAILTTLGLV